MISPLSEEESKNHPERESIAFKLSKKDVRGKGTMYAFEHVF